MKRHLRIVSIYKAWIKEGYLDRFDEEKNIHEIAKFVFLKECEEQVAELLAELQKVDPTRYVTWNEKVSNLVAGFKLKDSINRAEQREQYTLDNIPDGQWFGVNTRTAIPYTNPLNVVLAIERLPVYKIMYDVSEERCYPKLRDNYKGNYQELYPDAPPLKVRPIGELRMTKISSWGLMISIYFCLNHFTNTLGFSRKGNMFVMLSI